MKKKHLIAAIALTCAGSAALAAGCGKPRNAFDQVYCAGNLFSQVDKELNQAYGDLRKQLNDGQKDALKQGQLSWIRQRDAECSEEKPNGYFVNLDCAVTMTQSRLDFLKTRARECSSTGCETSKLGQ
jgi:uncharacterized protein YecT (DUF1311 family)